MSRLVKLRGRQDYDTLLNRMLQGAAISSPQFVADYIETSDIDFDQSLVAQTAFRYVQRNPDAAAQWAAGLDDPQYCDWALESVVDRSSQQDAPAATRWVMSQPRGAARDRLLDTMIPASVFSPNVDPKALLRAYRSDASAQRTLAEVIVRSTRLPSSMLDDSLDRAELLIELLTDPVFRRQAEDQIAAAR
jgi:hypothetical protein